MSLQSPLWLLVGLGLLLLGLLRGRTRLQDDWSRVINTAMLSRLRPAQNLTDSLLPHFLLAAGIALALSNPVTPDAGEDETFSSTETWWALVDVSESMAETDLNPSRLEAVQRQLDHLREAAGARPLGLVVFAGDAFLAHPATHDHSAFADFSAVLETDLVPLAGSRPGRALALLEQQDTAVNTLRHRFWVFSDGDGIDESALESAARLAQAGHRIDLVLAGQNASPVAEALARTGGGALWQMDALGRLPSRPFAPERIAREKQQLRLTLGGYRHWSHWWLLLLLPLCRWLMRRPAP